VLLYGSGSMVVKIEMFGLKLPEIKPGDDLVRLILDEASRTAGGIKDGDIIVVTSKIVSKAYNFLIKLDEVEPSKEAYKLAKKLNMDPRFIQAVLDQSDEILFVFPFYELVKEGIISLEKISKNVAEAYEVLKRIPYMLVVRRGNQIYTDAGLDFSNNPEGILSALPKNLDKIAKEIRRKIFELTGKDVAVVISDTEMWLSLGSLDFARGSSGIEVVSKNFGELDLYGKPKFGGVDHVAHEIACAAALLMGQTAKGIPAVIIRGCQYQRSEEGISNYQIDLENVREIIKKIIKCSIKTLGLKWLLKILK